jgi:hypothetical protein
LILMILLTCLHIYKVHVIENFAIKVKHLNTYNKSITQHQLE